MENLGQYWYENDKFEDKLYMYIFVVVVVVIYSCLCHRNDTKKELKNWKSSELNFKNFEPLQSARIGSLVFLSRKPRLSEWVFSLSLVDCTPKAKVFRYDVAVYFRYDVSWYLKHELDMLTRSRCSQVLDRGCSLSKINKIWPIIISLW